MDGNCCICKKEIEVVAFVRCVDLDFCHGKSCKCYLPIGSTCIKKFKGKKYDTNFQEIKGKLK